MHCTCGQHCQHTGITLPYGVPPDIILYIQFMTWKYQYRDIHNTSAIASPDILQDGVVFHVILSHPIQSLKHHSPRWGRVRCQEAV